MEPLSCKNCCHNPLQLSAVGTAFGFCTRHRVVLRVPHLTTCGQLLRKDLRAPGAVRAREAQRAVFRVDRISVLADPRRSAEKAALTEPAGSQMPDDAVVEEVMDYGLLDSKLASLAALHRIGGARAEIAMVSLGRGYFQACIESKRRWTSGIHLFQWTLARLTDDPSLGASDLQGPITLPIQRLLDLSRWQIVVQRLALVADIADHAGREGDAAIGKLVELVERALIQTEAGSAESLLSWLRKRASKVRSAFPRERYDKLRKALHPKEDAA
jgi:hypothetical protein